MKKADQKNSGQHTELRRAIKNLADVGGVSVPAQHSSDVHNALRLLDRVEELVGVERINLRDAHRRLYKFAGQVSDYESAGKKDLAAQAEKNRQQAQDDIKQMYAATRAAAAAQNEKNGWGVGWPEDGVKSPNGNVYLQCQPAPEVVGAPDSVQYRFHICNGAHDAEDFCVVRRYAGETLCHIYPAPRWEFMFSSEGGPVVYDTVDAAATAVMEAWVEVEDI